MRWEDSQTNKNRVRIIDYCKAAGSSPTIAATCASHLRGHAPTLHLGGRVCVRADAAASQTFEPQPRSAKRALTRHDAHAPLSAGCEQPVGLLVQRHAQGARGPCRWASGRGRAAPPSASASPTPSRAPTCPPERQPVPLGASKRVERLYHGLSTGEHICAVADVSELG